MKIGTETWKISPSGHSYDVLINASIVKYGFSSGRLQVDKSWKLQVPEPAGRWNYELNGSSVSEPDNQVKTAYSASNPGPLYEAITEVMYRDLKGNAEELRMVDKDISAVMLWDTVSGNKLAEAGGARYDEVGYAGFDEAMADGLSYIEASLQKYGHFTAKYVGYISTADGICGKYYKLDLTLNRKVTFDYNMKTGKEYILSFWCKGVLPAVTGAGISSFSFQEVYSQGSWKYYVARFIPTATTPIEIKGKSGSTIYVDEVRLHPSDVQMQTHTYTPLFGKTAEADATGRITYYEYDDFGRLITVKDQEGNVLKHIEIDMVSPN
ncbi:RHS repeat protein [Niabella sp. W65]|nr:RHS repeat protein [Niabella sp. W65]MCH7364880.1 RHS repeat protein [Niabella sp. W65]ULT40714.1 RHS repeat protein [Niabella sp. I65]